MPLLANIYTLSKLLMYHALLFVHLYSILYTIQSRRDLSYIVPIPVDDTSIPNLLKALLRPYTVAKRLYKQYQLEHNDPLYKSNLDLQRQSTLHDDSVTVRPLGALYHVNGKLKPGQMTLILAPPGHGKSTLLKLLSQRTVDKTLIRGTVTYNGLEADEVRQRHWFLEKLLAYV
jgi:ABC-type multidrug transport system fused ATPase/permease subunit